MREQNRLIGEGEEMLLFLQNVNIFVLLSTDTIGCVST